MSIALTGEGSFGLSIAGGGGSPPYIEGDGSVFISRVVPDGRASKAGIEVGDKLVEINGANVLETEHETVANQLRCVWSSHKFIINETIDSGSCGARTKRHCSSCIDSH